MNTLGRLVSGITNAFDFNSATLSGALDVIVIKHPDGSLHCTPFHVRFGKLKLLRSREKTIRLLVNGESTEIRMKLGNAGEAFFVEETEQKVETELSTSPILSPDSSSPPIAPISIGEEEEKQVEMLLPQSPNSVMKELDLPKQSAWQWLWGKPPQKKETTKPPEKPKSLFGSIFGMFGSKQEDSELEMSLCGGLIGGCEDLETLFDENKVSFEVFSEDPWKIIGNPNLMFKIEGKLYNVESGIPLILSILAFNQEVGTEKKEPKEEDKMEQLELPPLEQGSETIVTEESVDELPEVHPSEDTKSSDSEKKTKYFKKTLRLNSEELAKLKLKPGVNSVVYTVNSSFQGKQSIEGKIYLWDSDSKIVVSDIDGTITKSDILGHILPMVGKDWSHPGVVNLYNSIIRNGYKIIYLSSRAIGQVRTTKEYLGSVSQNNKGLPDGPVLMSPDRLIESFVREVIKRVPQKFKAGVLRDVAGLFPNERNPFYAGFGNRDSDAIAYRAAGVPLHKIFIINPSGAVFVFNNTFCKTYTEINTLVSEIFPNIIGLISDEEYSNINFWRVPFPQILEELD